MMTRSDFNRVSSPVFDYERARRDAARERKQAMDAFMRSVFRWRAPKT